MQAALAILATDLDRTMIYSRSALALGDATASKIVAVEEYRDAAHSFMTEAAHRDYAVLAAAGAVVPVTTRLPEQYARVRLPGPPPRWAIAANGGVLYADGSIDTGWTRCIAARLAAGFPQPAVLAYARAACGQTWTSAIRDADGLFCYAIVAPEAVPVQFIADAAGWAAERGWRISWQGRKLYWVPDALSKGAALAEVVARAAAARVLAAGDSLLDIDLLLAADQGIHPRHGELYEQGWSAPTVCQTSHTGGRAAEDILSWFAARRV